MVGAGIFALLGEAGAVAGSAVWLSFLLAGIVSALLGYTVVKLGVRYPSSGGIIAYLMEGFGNGRLVGIASWLGYFAAIVIVCSMVAVSFGSYATSLFVGDDAAAGWDNLFTSLIVSRMAGINMVGSQDRRPGAVADRRRPAGGLRRLHRRHPGGRSTSTCSRSAAIRRSTTSSRASPSRSSPTSASASSPSPSATCATPRASCRGPCISRSA